MTSKSKELTPDVSKMIVDLSTQGFSGEKISELLDILNHVSFRIS
jgi:hypothetical protein